MIRFLVDCESEGINDVRIPRIYSVINYEIKKSFVKFVLRFGDSKITLLKEKKYCVKSGNVIIYSKEGLEKIV